MEEKPLGGLLDPPLVTEGLREDKSMWPADQRSSTIEDSEKEKEKVKKFATLQIKEGVMFDLEQVIDINRYGTEMKLYKVTALVKRLLSSQYITFKQLGVDEDADRILRCYGRLENLELINDAKKPILLPRNHHLTLLITEVCHRRTLHGGERQTLAELRSMYWVCKRR